MGCTKFPYDEDTKSDVTESDDSLDLGAADSDVNIILSGMPERAENKSALEIDADKKPIVHLSSLLRLKATHLASIGSLVHSQGDCRVCAHENRRQHWQAKPCRYGALCLFCHEQHGSLRAIKKSK